MSHKFFISHYSGDKNIAEIFSAALRRITLEQISPWFSSDESSSEGLRPGDIWFTQILSKLMDSRAVVALLTPNSINRPWIYFESGIAQALQNCDVIPVCIGIKRDSLLPPLGLYQAYQLNDYHSAVEFFSKLLGLFKIKFDEEMSRVVLERMISEISRVTFKNHLVKDEETKNIEDVLGDLKSFLDRRFVELMEKPTYNIAGDNLKISVENFDSINKERVDNVTTYSIGFDIAFPNGEKNILYVDVREHESFQSLINKLFFMINDYVEPYTYLEKWIIKKKDLDIYVVIREISELIPAKFIFKPSTDWEIKFLSNPYNSLDSKERMLALDKYWPDFDNLSEKDRVSRLI